MKKTDGNEVVTKGYFRKELKKELDTFGQQLKKEISYELRNEMDIKFNVLYENMKDWKDEILRGNDKLMQRFDHFEKENASVQLNYRYIKDDVEDLQVRMKVLEKVT